MAGDWIKMRTALADDPAVIAMADALDTDEFSVVGRLHHLWSWADAQSRDGHAAGVTCRWINRYVRCDQFAEAMISVNWLVSEDGGIRFPNFDRHNGETAKARGLATNRKQKQRSSVTDESHDASRSERDESVTREEKRREELKTEGTNTVRGQAEEIAQANSATHAAELSKAMRESGIESSPSDPRLQALAEQGVSVATVRDASQQARKAKPNERIAPGYVISIIERWAAEAKRMTVAGAQAPARNTNLRDAARAAAANSIGLGAPSYDDQSTVIDADFRRIA
jgi:hypothetical protein